MTKAPVSFGTRRTELERNPFLINDVQFASRPLSISEEMRLVALSAEDHPDDAGAIDRIAGAVAEVLAPRLLAGEVTVDVDWVKENLTPDDLEGVVSYLRGGQEEHSDDE